MKPLTAEEIAELRRLDREATPGLWEARACSVVTPRNGFDIDALPRPEEADLIAAARNALPRLLDEMERLRIERDAARELLNGDDVTAYEMKAAALDEVERLRKELAEAGCDECMGCTTWAPDGQTQCRLRTGHDGVHRFLFDGLSELPR